VSERSRLRLAAMAALMTAAALGLVAAAPATPSVTIDNFTFNPNPIVVAPGEQVVWTNGDDVPHTVRAEDGSFRSKPMDTGDSYAFTFTKPGIYTYFCSIHPKMVGKVIVRAP